MDHVGAVSIATQVADTLTAINCELLSRQFAYFEWNLLLNWLVSRGFGLVTRLY